MNISTSEKMFEFLREHFFFITATAAMNNEQSMEVVNTYNDLMDAVNKLRLQYPWLKTKYDAVDEPEQNSRNLHDKPTEP